MYRYYRLLHRTNDTKYSDLFGDFHSPVAAFMDAKLIQIPEIGLDRHAYSWLVVSYSLLVSKRLIQVAI